MAFAALQSAMPVPELFGVTDGKAVGTHVEKAFKAYLATKYLFEEGNAAKGIDFPELAVDVKVTSVDQPQSSSPFRSARQKIFGLGYSLLVSSTTRRITRAPTRRSSTCGTRSSSRQAGRLIFK